MKTNPRAAFSVLELVVAIAVFVIGFFALFDLLNAALSQTHQVEQTRIALSAAQSEIESLRAMPFVDLRQQENGAFLVPMPTLAQLHDGAGGLTVRARAERLKEINVTVRWTAGKLGAKQITLTTLVFNPMP